MYLLFGFVIRGIDSPILGLSFGGGRVSWRLLVGLGELQGFPRL